MNQQSFINLFEREKAAQAWSDPARQDAFTKFLELALPDRKNESYRYISLSFLQKKSELNLVWPDKLSDKQKALLETEMAKHQRPNDINITLVDGIVCEELTGKMPKGISLNKKNAYPDLLEDGLEALSQALNQEGLSIDVTKDANNVRINLFYFILKAETDSALAFSQHQLNLAPGVQAELCEYFIALDTKSAQVIAPELKITLAKDASLKHFRMESLEQSELTFLARVRAVQKEHSSYQVFSFTTGAKLSRTLLQVQQVDTACQAEFCGLALIGSDRKHSLTTNFQHQARQGKSKQYVKSVVLNEGRFSFLGGIKILKDAKFCEATKLVRNLIMSPKAEVNSRPILEIDNQDVKCSHGATTARLSKEELFYFQSRGIVPEVAKTMLCTGFLDEITLNIFDDFLQNLVREKIRSQAF